jgi:uncharacterized protein involved in exopolysaccharide biosynthesis
MSREPNSLEINQDEITLRDVILKIRENVHELWKHKFLVIVITLPIVVYIMYKTFNTPSTYTSTTRFIIEGQSGGIGGLLGQFGIRSGSNAKSNPFTTIEVARSKELLKEVLFSKVGNTNEWVINAIIKEYELDKNWIKKNPELAGFLFKTRDISKFSENERKIYLEVLSMVTGSKETNVKGLMNISVDEESNIFTLNAITLKEDLSLTITDKIYDNLKYFFEERAIASLKNTRDLLAKKVDSLQAQISGKAYAAARFDDTNKGLISATRGVTKSNMSRDITILSAALAETIKSYEMADYAYRDAKPQFLKIDVSMSPLNPKKPSKLKSLLTSLLLGIFISAFFIIFRNIYRKAMQEIQ